MSGIFHEGRWYEDTGLVCRRCKSPVYASDVPGYRYQCFWCDEDLFFFEVEKIGGCAFELRHGGVSRYYAADSLGGMAGLAVCILNDALLQAPGLREVSAAEWHGWADRPDSVEYRSFLVVDMDENTLVANEDAGRGMAYYRFPLRAVLDEAAVSPWGLWDRLLGRFPAARMDRPGE